MVAKRDRQLPRDRLGRRGVDRAFQPLVRLLATSPRMAWATARVPGSAIVSGSIGSPIAHQPSSRLSSTIEPKSSGSMASPIGDGARPVDGQRRQALDEDGARNAKSAACRLAQLVVAERRVRRLRPAEAASRDRTLQGGLLAGPIADGLAGEGKVRQELAVAGVPGHRRLGRARAQGVVAIRVRQPPPATSGSSDATGRSASARSNHATAGAQSRPASSSQPDPVRQAPASDTTMATSRASARGRGWSGDHEPTGHRSAPNGRRGHRSAPPPPAGWRARLKFGRNVRSSGEPADGEPEQDERRRPTGRRSHPPGTGDPGQRDAPPRPPCPVRADPRRRARRAAGYGNAVGAPGS